jgi:isoleucyl-tRNA synthetase
MAKKRQLEAFNGKNELRVRKFWKKEGIPEKVGKQNEGSKETYYFMDGPPYATGHIHMGTALNKILKDVAIRTKRMQGFHVFDRPGYDTHGLPIEKKVEEKLGFERKEQIEAYGIDKFVGQCRHFATEFIDVMNAEFDNLGVWMEWKNPYLTLEDSYIEAIWWSFKKADEKGLLYKGLYPVHVCPRCETVVSFNEIEYEKQTDESVFVKFPLREKKSTFLVIWTTTPWTLPGNTGIMVHPNFDYAFVKLSNGETWVVAKEKVQELMDTIEAGYAIEKVVKGSELEGLRYMNPLQRKLKLPPLENGYRVILSERYVNLDEGTGLVHTAPGHGKEDFDAGNRAGLPAISPVGLNGLLKEEAGKYAGKKCREVDKEIIEDLEYGGMLVYKHPYTHDYPVCWRCKSPLLMLSVEQWFFKIRGIQDRMLALNQEVNWVPSWMQDRMKNWLEGISDWPISRARYWGTPLPIWLCENCGIKKVVESKKELQQLSRAKAIDMHKPGIDKIEFPCSCGGSMKRVPEVLDVWFDAGVSSWAALGYPGEEKLFDKFWPADLNLEGTDQFRGWWNSELILSTICFDKVPFRNILVHGIILDLEKRKMSKSEGNIVQPKEVIEKYSRDYLRYYLIGTSRGEDFAFNWDAFKDIHRFFNVLWNAYNYALIYLDIDLEKAEKLNPKELAVEDKWILSRANSLTGTVLQAYKEYTFFKATAALEQFVLEDLSRTYIKLVRERAGEKGVSMAMAYVLDRLLRLLSPVTPHIAEHLFQGMRSGKRPESVHLLTLKEADKKLVDKKLEEIFERGKLVTQATLALREENKLRRRWPLRKLVIVSKTGKEFAKVKGVIASSSNVREVEFAAKKPGGNFAEKEVANARIFLDVEADAELKENWELQELRRKVQELRKQAKLMPGQKAKLRISSSDQKFVEKFKVEIESSTNTVLVSSKKKPVEKLYQRKFGLQIVK